jgi:hypothetical protein
MKPWLGATALCSLATIFASQPWVRLPTKCDAIPRRDQMVRSINTTRGTLRLGEPPPPTMRRVSARDSVIYLGAGVVQRAESMEVYLTRDGRVAGLSITYGPDSVRFDTLARAYRRRLGWVPVHSLRQPADIRTVAACWRDSRSRFRVAAVLGPGEGSVFIDLSEVGDTVANHRGGTR